MAHVPSSIDVVDFTAVRSAELQALRRALLTTSGNRRVHQTLSWHARRRTMSHTSYRSPHRIRHQLQAQLAQQRPPGTVEPKPGPRGKARMRKYRRKARYLQSIRKLRAKNPAWLETHIWHAKRFKMMQLGDRKVAWRCNDRGERSCYRAVKTGCVGHDESYLECIQLSGERENLKKALRQRMNVEDGNLCTTDAVVAGKKRAEGVVMEGNRAIGPVEILWMGEKVWMWMMPMVVSEVLRVFTGEGWQCEVLKCAPCRFGVYGAKAGGVLGGVLGVEDDKMKYVVGVGKSGCVGRGCIVRGWTRDPRERFPPKVEKTGGGVYVEQMEKVLGEWEGGWEEEERLELKQSVLEGRGVEKVPFILMQVEEGWELIVPQGWGMRFWNSLMYSTKGRAMGQLEMRMIKLEAGKRVFPEDFGDTVVGAELLKKVEGELREKYERRPKGKRVDYELNCVESPWYADMGKIVGREIELGKKENVEGPIEKKAKSECEEEGGRVIRSESMLRECLGEVFMGLLPKRERRRYQMGTSSRESISTMERCTLFVPIHLKALGKGVPLRLALICEPTGEDVNVIKAKGAKWEGVGEETERGKKKEGCRRVIGRVTVGGFSFGQGRGKANGFVAVNALRRCGVDGSSGQIVVLFRNVDSLQYRSAIATVAV